MEILVCVKQVPDTAEVKIDPVKHTVIRAGVPSTRTLWKQLSH